MLTNNFCVADIVIIYSEINHSRLFAIGSVTRVTKTLVEVRVGETKITYKINSYGNCKCTNKFDKAYARSIIRHLKSDETIENVSLAIEKQREQEKQYQKTLQEKQETDRIAKEIERQETIAKFWETEGKTIWESRQTVDLFGAKLIVLQQRIENNYTIGKQFFLHITTHNKYDYPPTNEQVLRIDRGGIEIRQNHCDDANVRMSVWSDSCYYIDLDDNWEKVLVWKECSCSNY